MTKENIIRAKEIIEKKLYGKRMSDIALEYGITRQRVEQIVKVVCKESEGAVGLRPETINRIFKLGKSLGIRHKEIASEVGKSDSAVRKIITSSATVCSTSVRQQLAISILRLIEVRLKLMQDIVVQIGKEVNK